MLQKVIAKPKIDKAYYNLNIHFKYRIVYSSKLFLVSVFVCVLINSSCNQKQAPFFRQLEQRETGIGFVNHIAETDSMNLLTYTYLYNGAGVAAGDVNNDGLEDIFFTANTKAGNKLYINKGNFIFDDVTIKAGVQGKSDFCTGAVMVDMNADGWLDLYVSTVNIPGKFNSANELYVNNRNGTFTESAASYHLNFSGHTTQTSFFDYDRDGDLDCFLLNHSDQYTDDYKDASARKLVHPFSGHKLLQNEDGVFVNVTEEAGIYSSSLGFGLGIAVGDINNDGWQDMYVSNDFKEHDYCYINNGNGTFTESVTNMFSYVSRFSMGNDLADYNNDGRLDLITLDMLSQDEKILKSTVSDDDMQTYDYRHKLGFHYQYSRNCLQQNRDGIYFTEAALQTGVAATDWSWAPLFADFNNDGFKDLFISNGYKYRLNSLDFINFLNETAEKNKQVGIKNNLLQLSHLAPAGITPDFFYLNNNGETFTNISEKAGFTKPTLSNGTAYADFDNDGDLDLVVNRIDEPAGVYQNNMPAKNFLRIQLKGDSANTFGIGAMLYVFAGGTMQLVHQSPVRGFMSSVSHRLHIGLGNHKTVDSLIIIWPNGTSQQLKNISANKQIELVQRNASKEISSPALKKEILTTWEDVTDRTGINFIHREDEFDDLNVQPFLPHSLATQGPKTTVADVNGDGLQDVYLCGAKNQHGQLFIQTNQSTFVEMPQASFVTDSVYEDTDALLFDADGDKDNDLYVTSGGNQLFGREEFLKDRLYINDGKGTFTRDKGLTNLYENKSCVRAADFDKDGDIDLFVGGRANARMYGYTPASVILQNNGKGVFAEVTETISAGLINIGMVTDACWTDIDKDGWQDLIIVGEWMPVTIFKNQKGKLVKQAQEELKNSTGWWTCIYATDIDNDGDEDFLLGNWGTNTKLLATAEHPLKLFVGDWDKNNEIDPILSVYKNSDYYTFLTKPDLERRLPYLKKQFLKFTDMAGKTASDIFGKENLAGSRVLQAATLKSSVLKNENGKFLLEALPSFLQTAPVFAFSEVTVKNGSKQYIAAGNFYEVQPYEGRYDALLPVFFSIRQNKINQEGFLLQHGQVRAIKIILLKNEEVLLFVRNNQKIVVVKQTAN
jgi:enediyne biosynthesis protein E4